MNIRRVIDGSYRSAAKALVMGTSPQTLARARERAFVRALVAELEAAFADDADMRVFSEYGHSNESDFGTEKLPGDVTVGRTAESSTSGRQSQSFLYLAELLWQIEIEFSQDWRRAIYAINRLNSGSAANKMLVSAIWQRGGADCLQTLAAPFAAGAGSARLALIPHPDDWESTEDQPAVWQLSDGQWVEAD